MSFNREMMRAMGVLDCESAKKQRDGAVVKVGGLAVVRQRSGTAKSFVLLSLEDETDCECHREAGYIQSVQGALYK